VGNEVQFGGPGTSVAGNSFFWSNGRYGADQFYTAETVKWLKDNWGAQIVRAAMAVDDDRPGSTTTIEQLGGYLTQRFDNQFNVQKVVNAAIANGMYAIIDFHAHRAQGEIDEAVQFFTEMATFYGGFNNVIYEIYNEPTNTSWAEIKAYAQRVIPAIRAVDPDNLIIVGTPNFSQDVDVAAGDPIDDPNVAYTLHFYAGEGAHDQLRTKATAAMNDGIALFVTEWGTTPANGLGAPNQNSTNTWMDFLQANDISHCNWGVADQTEQGAAQLARGASPSGGWTDAQLSASGQLAKRIISAW
jgi:endoglucanase